MSIKIHHGPPGSYKTSGAVMDDFIPAAKAGRVVITNVRGLSSRDKVEEALGELPESFKLIYLPTHESDEAVRNRDYWARWFHWAEKGAFFLIDEAQDVFPKAWTASDLKTLDYPGGREAAAAERRPATFLQAFEMHRHYGWDLILTTPNIKKIRDDIRGCSEGAYKHKNLALVGLKGRYIEAFHLADDSGSAASDFLSIRRRKIKSHVWKLYDSTTTGTHSDTLAGSPLWKNPRVVILFGILGAALSLVGVLPAPRFFSGKSSAAVAAAPSAPVPGVGAPVSALPPAAPAARPVPGPSLPQVVLSDFLAGQDVRLFGQVSDGRSLLLLFEARTKSGRIARYKSLDLQALGYEIGYIRRCLVSLRFQGQKQLVDCRPFEESGPVADAR